MSGVHTQPNCFKCKRDQGIYCIECGSDSIACQCPVIDDLSEWYCVNCDHEFFWDESFGIAYDYDGYEQATTEQLYEQDSSGKWWYKNGEEVKCYCHVPKKLSCSLCQVSREVESANWSPWVDITVSEPTKSHPHSAYAWGSSWDKKFTKCDHLMTPVRLQTTTVYASSLNDNRTHSIPDWGLYADWSWRPYWRNEHIDWKDLGLPEDYDIAFEQISYAYDLARAGKTVEIGCIGGHGRTGTILCCMAVLDGMTAQEALTHIELTYCADIVETFEQEWFIKWFEATAYGNTPPEKPQPKPSSSSFTLTTTTSTCTIADHYSIIKTGSFTCKVSGCKTFERDFKWYSQVNIKPDNKPAIGTFKDGYVYTVNGWEPSFATQLKDSESK